jgi:hypothetical protein
VRRVDITRKSPRDEAGQQSPRRRRRPVRVVRTVSEAAVARLEGDRRPLEHQAAAEPPGHDRAGIGGAGAASPAPARADRRGPERRPTAAEVSASPRPSRLALSTSGRGGFLRTLRALHDLTPVRPLPAADAGATPWSPSHTKTHSSQRIP